MNIIRLEGTDNRLYPLIGPLVMNPAVIRQNNNYPFKTSKNHIWYIAVSDQNVIGFIPLKRKGTSCHIDNYYIQGDNPDTINELLRQLIEDLKPETVLTALVHKRHIDLFTEYRFQTEKEWTLYDKMEYKHP